MIYTLTLNPALDLEFSVEEIRYNQVLRASRVRADCGGKGFNIARALREVGVSCQAWGLVGGKTGERLAEELEKLGVQAQFTWIAGETRTNIAVVTSPLEQYIKVNQAGPAVTKPELEDLLGKIRGVARAGDVWVLSGSLPPGAPADTYFPIINEIQMAGGKALVDADGETLLQACRARPFLVKPNALEAGEVTGIAINTPQEAAQACRRFHEWGVEAVLITLAEQGAVLSVNGEAWWARPPEIPIQSPIGAGDASLAGFVWGLNRGLDYPQCLRLCVASGTASASLPGTAVAPRTLIEEVERGVLVTPV
jgi:1-phosphofructokinase family hexose kinase